jgi:hypothetical protein
VAFGGQQVGTDAEHPRPFGQIELTLGTAFRPDHKKRMPVKQAHFRAF